MPCPVCGYSNPAGTAKCAACGTQLIAEPKPVARVGDAVCATHQELPALQPCHRCGTFYCAQCLERAADGQMYCISCRERSSLPWDQREQVGMLRAWFQTCTKLLLEPTQTLASTARDGTIGSSLLFSVVSSIAGFLTTLLGYLVIFGGMAIAAATQNEKLGGQALGIGAVGAIAIFIFYLVFLLGFQIVMVFVLAGIEHLVLHLSGEPTLGPYTVTVRAHALGLAPYVLGLIPFCGLMVMGLWSLVLRCITLMQLQKVSAGKAVVAVLAPVVVLCGCFGLMYFIIIAAAFSAVGSGSKF